MIIAYFAIHRYVFRLGQKMEVPPVPPTPHGGLALNPPPWAPTGRDPKLVGLFTPIESTFG